MSSCRTRCAAPGPSARRRSASSRHAAGRDRHEPGAPPRPRSERTSPVPVPRIRTNSSDAPRPSAPDAGAERACVRLLPSASSVAAAASPVGERPRRRARGSSARPRLARRRGSSGAAVARRAVGRGLGVRASAGASASAVGARRRRRRRGVPRLGGGDRLAALGRLPHQLAVVVRDPLALGVLDAAARLFFLRAGSRS